MQQKKALIATILFVLMLGAGTVAAFMILRGSNQTTEEASVEPSSPPTLTVQSSTTTLNAQQEATLDIFLNTFGAEIEGFQFIATIDGPAAATVRDADTTIAGVQITPASLAALSTATNSVIDQQGKQVVRFAMITTSPTQGYKTDVPVKVASIAVNPNSAGSLKLAFNPQNTRASIPGGEDMLIAASDTSFAVAGTLVTPVPLAVAPSTTPSAALAKATASGTMAASTSSKLLGLMTAASPTATPKTALIAQGTSTSSGSLGTTVSTASATATPRATATATPSATPYATLAATLESMPVSGSVEQTILLVVGGVVFLGLGIGSHILLRHYGQESS